MTKEQIFLDLSKCSEIEQRELIATLPEEEFDDQYSITGKHFKLILSSRDNKWWVFNSLESKNKKEVNFQQFKEIIAGENLQVDEWIKIESEKDLPKESCVYWTLRKGFIYPMYVVVGDEEIDKEYWLKNYSHYQPIIRPNPPINKTKN